MSACSSAKDHCEYTWLALRALTETRSVPLPFFLRLRFRRFAWCSGGHGQIANPDIDADDVHELCRGWRGEIDGQGHEQIELLLWPVIPQFCIPDGGSLPNERDVLFVALVGNTDPSVQRPDTDLAIALKGVIPLLGVLNSG
jgi:hypothetical protein